MYIFSAQLLLAWALLCSRCHGYIPLKQSFCDSGDPDVVLRQWRTVFSGDMEGKTKLTLSIEVFAEMARRVPEIANLFERVQGHDPESPIYHAHLLRVMTGLDILLDSLKQDGVLHWHVEWLSIKHMLQSRVKPEYFLVFKDVLLDSLPSVIEGFDSDAWDNCLSPLMRAISALNVNTAVMGGADYESDYALDFGGDLAGDYAGDFGVDLGQALIGTTFLKHNITAEKDLQTN